MFEEPRLQKEPYRYLCIDLKSFYASVECVERGLDPMTTNLVVADPERSDKTICLAVSPSMKALGVRNRCRVFEIPKGISYIMAPPRMQMYLQYAAEIYGIYLQYVSKDDIHVYSIDEAFLDVAEYLNLYQMNARQMGQTIMQSIEEQVGVRATCGIGTNLYLTKIALDITAKHSPDYIGMLSEKSYRETLWQHRPLTDFWRIGHGTAHTLAENGIYTMQDIAQADEDLLYHLFGVDAELLIDHAWGREPVTLQDIKRYKGKTRSLGSGQVLMRDYLFEEGELIVKEMADLLCLDLVKQKQVTRSITLHIGYTNQYAGASAHGTISLEEETNADRQIVPAVIRLYRQIVNPEVPIRRVFVTCNRITHDTYRQLDLFDQTRKPDKIQRAQEAALAVKNRYGKNAILKGMNLEESGTTRERNRQIGGHKSGIKES